MNLRSERFWVAMVLTLSLHALVLFVLWMQPAGRYAVAANAFIPVEFADLEAAESVAPTFEQQLRAQMESRVSNLVAELRAMEQAEFERLAADQKDFGLEMVPDDGQNGQVNTLSGWDQRYEGRVIVSYDVANRRHVYLPIPGYQCLEAGKVVVEVEIARDGSVTKARLVQSAVGEAEACLNTAALKYALRSEFRTGVDQSGTITYEFVAQ